MFACNSAISGHNQTTLPTLHPYRHPSLTISPFNFIARVRAIPGENIGIVNVKMRTDHPVAVRPVRSGDLLLDGMAIDGIGGSPSLSKV